MIEQVQKPAPTTAVSSLIMIILNISKLMKVFTRIFLPNYITLPLYHAVMTFDDLTLSQTCPGFQVSSVQVFWKHCGKGEIARNEQFLLLPQRFLPVRRTFCHFSQIRNCRLQTLSVWKSLKFVVRERVNERSLFKTLWEKEKCWSPAFSPLPTMFYTQSKRNSTIWATNEIVVCQYFQFGQC